MTFNNEQRKAMWARKNNRKCDYNFMCEDNAKDGSSKEWWYRVENNAPAKHLIKFSNKENPDNEFEYDVCDGCLDMLDDGDNIVHDIQHNLYEPKTESYVGQRSRHGQYHISQPRAYTQKDIDKSIKDLKRYSALTPEQRDAEFVKKYVPKIRKANMKYHGRYVIDEQGKYIGDKELAKMYGA